ncbi:MAG TPA: hypothetical protein VF879_03690, partial [Nitrospirales bacterium]
MTQVQVSEIPAEGLRLSYSEDPAELDLSVPGASFSQPLAVEILLLQAAEAISVTGRIKVQGTFE